MKINILDAHDRLTYIQKQNFSISECCQDMINQRPFGNHAFYIFAHPRTDEDGITKRLIWQPRLTRPKAQTNSMLFKGYPGTDLVKVIWMIPDRCMWKQYEHGKLTQNKIISESIHDFQFNREKLEIKDDDDLQDYQIDDIYEQISKEMQMKRIKTRHQRNVDIFNNTKIDKELFMPMILEVSSTSSEKLLESPSLQSDDQSLQ
jgi:hypothetical protein